jgi:hypothetical protein
MFGFFVYFNYDSKVFFNIRQKKVWEETDTRGRKKFRAEKVDLDHHPSKGISGPAPGHQGSKQRRPKEERSSAGTDFTKPI